MTHSILAALLLLAGPALAHHGEPHPPVFAQAAPPRPERPIQERAIQERALQDPAIQEMQRERANPAVPPGVQARRRAAEEAEALEVQNALALLRPAREAIAARRYGLANELLDRAESRLLTRSTLAASADRPLQGGPVGQLAAARAAVQRQDQAEALREVDAMPALADRPRPPR